MRSILLRRTRTSSISEKPSTSVASTTGITESGIYGSEAEAFGIAELFRRRRGGDGIRRTRRFVFEHRNRNSQSRHVRFEKLRDVRIIGRETSEYHGLVGLRSSRTVHLVDAYFIEVGSYFQETSISIRNAYVLSSIYDRPGDRIDGGYISGIRSEKFAGGRRNASETAIINRTTGLFETAAASSSNKRMKY